MTTTNLSSTTPLSLHDYAQGDELLAVGVGEDVKDDYESPSLVDALANPAVVLEASNNDLKYVLEEQLVADGGVGFDHHDDLQNATGTSTSRNKKSNKKKRDGSTLRKAPQAPKRFKSSYICFFMAKQSEIKEELGDKATVTEISKRSATMWRTLPSEDRAHWDDVAAKDKQRYMIEKASYTGPWQVPWKRAKKDPSAPKRPMSSFLYFSQGRRRKIREANPQMKNTEVSRLLGEMWRNATEEDRRPHIDKEKEEREKYKIAIADWRKDFEARTESERKARADQAAHMANMYSRELHCEPQHLSSVYGDQHGMGQYPNQALNMNHPPHYDYGAPIYNYSAPYPLAGPPSQYPTDGKQPIILGPNGGPHYAAGYNQAPPPIHMQSPMPAPIPYNPIPPQQYEDPSAQYNHHHSPSAHFDYAPENFGE